MAVDITGTLEPRFTGALELRGLSAACTSGAAILFTVGLCVQEVISDATVIIRTRVIVGVYIAWYKGILKRNRTTRSKFKFRSFWSIELEVVTSYIKDRFRWHR